jgi:hypothetical protein
MPLASSSTLAIAYTSLMPVTRAGIWLRALIFMVRIVDESRSCSGPSRGPAYRIAMTRLLSGYLDNGVSEPAVGAR